MSYDDIMIHVIMMFFAGIEMPKNTCVWVFLPSANRDSNAFENPDKFDITRKTTNPHLAFGKGVHQCLGADLSKLEMKVALQQLIRKIGNRKIELKSFQNRPSLFLRGVENVIVQIHN